MENKKIKIITIGSGSMHIIKTMKEKNLDLFEYISIGSFEEAMNFSQADKKLIIGDDGMGTGGNPAKGKAWAELAKDQIKELINGAETLILYSCLGGGTGSGALPVVAKLAKEMEINTEVIVTLPFLFEGKKRSYNAEVSIEATKEYFENITITKNDDILKVVNRLTTMREAFKVIDEIVIKKIKDVIWE